MKEYQFEISFRHSTIMCTQREMESPVPPEMERPPVYAERRQQGDGAEEPQAIPVPTAPLSMDPPNTIGDDERMTSLMIRLRQDQTTTSNLSVEELIFIMNRILPTISMEHLNLLCRLLGQIYTM